MLLFLSNSALGASALSRRYKFKSNAYKQNKTSPFDPKLLLAIYWTDDEIMWILLWGQLPPKHLFPNKE